MAAKQKKRKEEEEGERREKRRKKRFQHSHFKLNGTAGQDVSGNNFQGFSFLLGGGGKARIVVQYFYSAFVC